MKSLIHYQDTINKFYEEDAMAVLDCTFNLTKQEKLAIKGILQYYSSMTGPMVVSKENIAMMKEICEHDWEGYLKDGRISTIHAYLRKLLTPRTPRNVTLFHTIMRTGEFFYMTDQEMNEMANDMDSFIEAGDCKLFDNVNSPYPDKELGDSFESDIKSFQKSIRKYLKKNGLPDISGKEVLDALEKIKGWIETADLEEIPIEARGMIQLCQEIRRDVCKEAWNLHWDFPGMGGIEPECIMKKMSGFCLNKEGFFKEFLRKTGMGSWKNPEGSWLYGASKYPWNPEYFEDMKKLSFWDMDVIYYSLGKGPWLKARYVGQPCAFYQNVAEPLARVVKNCIKYHHDRWKEGQEGILDAEGLNIYENYYYLLDMVSRMKDSIAMDFKSYSDYLSRNTFKWVMKYLWGVPDSYAKEIFFLMSLPIKVNGRVYPHKHASVMGIKVNFLLITFSNFLMWLVGCIITKRWDWPKFMGDDRIQICTENYTEEEVNKFFAVTAYFNCVVNSSKSEWLQRDKITSFCKRTFMEGGIQVSGFSGEYFLKQKPFLNDVSVWLNMCERAGIPITEDQRDRWIRYHAEYYSITDLKFHKKSDPPIEEMVDILLKIPYRYGGWSLEEPDDAMEEIMLRSVLATIATIIQDIQEERKDYNRTLVRQYILAQTSESNRYYQNLLRSNSYTIDLEKIRDYVIDVSNVLNKRQNSIEEIKKARIASQRLMEIVLDRDSRLASSSSTKNRINFKFDQDRVSKIRAKYVRLAAEERERKLASDMLDMNILNSMLKRDYKSGVYEYFDYIKAKQDNQCHICIYNNSFQTVWFGMAVTRYNDDGTSREFIKRLDADDSYYERIEKIGSHYYGKFVIEQDLTEGEKKVFKILQKAYNKKVIMMTEEALNAYNQEALLMMIEYCKELSAKLGEDEDLEDNDSDYPEDFDLEDSLSF